MDQASISEGIGRVVIGNDSTAGTGTTPTGLVFGLTNVRQRFIQGHSLNAIGSATEANFTIGAGFGSVPQSSVAPSGVTPSGNYTARRYQVNFALGLFTQDKLVHLRFYK
jgi:hypothetical protein